MIRVAINGYGRIGRIAHRVILEKFTQQIEVVGINAGSSTDIKGWMYLLKYDTVYGQIKNVISTSPKVLRAVGLSKAKDLTDVRDSSATPQNDKREVQNDAHLGGVMASQAQPATIRGVNQVDLIGSLVIDGKEIPVFSQKDPSLLSWKDLNVDVVIESTGAFKKEEQLKAHLTAGAKAVVLSAPIKSSNDGSGEVPTYVVSVNSQNYKGESIISNASCTTNCIAPVAKIMQDHFGIEKAMMTTIHGYTSDQRLQDGGHKDYRRARAAAANIVPTSTGATTAAAKAISELNGIFNGLAIRVPVAVGSLSDFTFLLKKETTKEEVNEIFKKEAGNPVYKGILTITEDPIVSSDIIGNPSSSIVDLSLTQVVGGNMVKVIAWYDNEYGYANRLVEEVLMVGKKLT